MSLVSLILCATAALAAAPEDPSDVEVHATIELAKGVCADPSMTDDERAEMIERSPEDAVRCMGRDWVYGDDPTVQTSSIGQLDIDANVSANRIRVTDRDGIPHWYLTSPGLPGRTETLTGEFDGPFRVENGNYVVQNPALDYVGAPMPWAVFYNWRAKKDTGFAIHGTNAVGQLGQPASHGCLRVRTSAAAFINKQVRMANDSSVHISVYGKAAFKPKPGRRRPPADDGGGDVPRPL